MSATSLLRVRDLAVDFADADGVVRAVDGLSFDVRRGEMLGIVGESGCGKSAACLAVLGLLPRGTGRIASGRIDFDGVDLTEPGAHERRGIRGRRIAMVFQDPMTSLNPYLTVEEQLAEVGELHLGLSRREAVARAVALLERVGIPDAALRARGHPHELSGGMRQRVMIAMALLCDPDLILADEPTTALDVTIQAQILALLRDLRRERGLAIALVTHDLGVVRATCDRVLVLYAGRAVETARAADLFRRPAHPYTEALLRSVPRLGTRARLASIRGLPPRLGPEPVRACRFAPRCPLVRTACLEAEPEMEEIAPGHARRCIAPVEEIAGP